MTLRKWVKVIHLGPHPRHPWATSMEQARDQHTEYLPSYRINYRIKHIKELFVHENGTVTLGKGSRSPIIGLIQDPAWDAFICCKLGSKTWNITANTYRVVTGNMLNSYFSMCKMQLWPWENRSRSSILDLIQDTPELHPWCKLGTKTPNTCKVIALNMLKTYIAMLKMQLWPWEMGQGHPSANSSKTLLRCIYGAS